MRGFWVLAVFGLGVLLSACQSLHTKSAKIIQTERQNITTSPSLSLSTQSILVASGYEQAGCLANFDACLTAVEGSYFRGNAKARLATLSELYYAYALQLQASAECQALSHRPPLDPYYANALPSAEQHQKNQNDTKACKTRHLDSLYNALRHSYAYVFYDNLTGETTTTNIANESSIRTQDIYHMAIHSLVAELYAQNQGNLGNDLTPYHIALKDEQSFVNMGVLTSQFDTDNTLLVYVANDPYYLHTLVGADERHLLSELKSIYDGTLPKLNITSSRTGLGVGYVGSLNDRHQNRLETLLDYQDNTDTKARIHPMGHLLMTAVVLPKGRTVDEVLASREFGLFILNPYQTDTVVILGKEYPLFANFSSGYANWLSENQFRGVALAQMLDKDKVRLPELYLLEPYNPNKKVIIMIHGLASSPSTWVNLTNSLFADPVLRDNYQAWQIFYATNLPILENRYQIQKLINDTFAKYDPKGEHKASQNATLIGHSMGAVIGRLMLSDDDLRGAVLANQQGTMTLKAQDEAVLAQRGALSALPQVDTAVFVSAPFRGTDYADRWFTRALRRVVQLPTGLTKSLKTALDSDEIGLADGLVGGLYLQNGASQLSDKSTFMSLTKDVKINQNVRYHSIMANNTSFTIKDTGTVSEHISDGIVPYSSSHLDGADSEIVIDGGHSIHENPKTVVHLRKILHEKLQQDKMDNE